jgi:hypothetical protein
MSVHHTVIRADGTPVRLTPLVRSRANGKRTVSPRRAAAINSGRWTAWIIRSIMLATAGFALLDLMLLASAGHR